MMQTEYLIPAKALCWRPLALHVLDAFPFHHITTLQKPDKNHSFELVGYSMKVDKGKSWLLLISLASLSGFTVA